MNKPRIEEYPTYSGKAANVYPFAESVAAINAVASPARESLHEKARYQVNWPSIGAQDTKTTRAFAAALIAACDWVDAQQKG